MRLIISFVVLYLCALVAGCSKADVATTPAQNSTGGSLARFTLSGNYLYVVDVNSLLTFSVANGSNPQLVNSLAIGRGIETIFSYKQHLYVGSEEAMYIYSIANPAAPQLMGVAQHLRACDPVVANDSTAFVTLRGGQPCGPANPGLYVYNTRNIAQPILVHTLPMLNPYGLALSDTTLFVCNGTNGMDVFSVQPNRLPVLRQTLQEGYDYRDVIAYRNQLICYVATGLVLYDISNLPAITPITYIAN